MKIIDKCPECGANVCLEHDVIHGEYDMGYWIGCMRYRLMDGIRKNKMAFCGFLTPETAIKYWKEKFFQKEGTKNEPIRISEKTRYKTNQF